MYEILGTFLATSDVTVRNVSPHLPGNVVYFPWIQSYGASKLPVALMVGNACLSAGMRGSCLFLGPQHDCWHECVARGAFKATVASLLLVI